MEKISVIVPVYNVERYLRKCIDSLLAQTYENLEIILIDDGSTDNSPNICDEYAANSKIRVIHKENGGVSDVRNIGLREATGEYIAFADSDDYVDSDMYEFLLGNALEYNADVSCCGIYHCYQSGVLDEGEVESGCRIYSREEVVKMVMDSSKMSVNPINKLYKREVLNGIVYPLGKTSEDAFVIIDILMNAQCIAISYEPKYYYVHRGNSITTSDFKHTDLAVIEAYEGNLEKIKTYFPDLIYMGEFRLYWSYFYLWDKMMNSKKLVKDSDYHMVLSYIKKHKKQILSNTVVSKRRKIACRITCFSPWLYRRVLKYTSRRRIPI